ncbi:sodium/hydrogen exchanger 3 domain protein [Ancylostoma caninum]|uniref:Sodium/hydrogen exchanger n=1 Tax=Ancylostoma caninum TaxID=29170 RepID=A0A368G0R4_ANCCA|nr:sodium/hydrogen exchanger 3 domain protein [Ancylostoma caninum]
MRLLLNLLLLLFPSFVVSIELNIENETEFWSDILNYADSVGVRRSVLATLLRLDPDVAIAVYHHTHYIQKIIPESCCLILVGVGLGLIFIGDDTHESVKFLEFNSKTFFFFLLPPIILESAYSLRDRAFLENIGTIILYAVVGTVLNIVLIGGSLVVLSHLGWIGGFRIDPLDCLVFASLIAAVDPVAVLAIFQEVGVNKMLYFMVFGESLLNDAVTVVCYNLLIEFKALDSIGFLDCFIGFLAFLCVSLGGLAIGLFFGFLSAFVTKFTKDVRVVEPVIMFGMAYMAYMGSELFHFSGIIGIIACGLFQTHYSCGNISNKSFISVTYFAKVASSVSESLIFIVLGVMLVNEQEWFWSDWHPLFSLYSVVLCIGVRFLVVFFLTYIVNRFTGGVRHISFQEQFIMAYGGLRGAVSFSLAFMISNTVAVKNTILSATYMVILVTVFLQGGTIKPLVRYLNIRLARKEDNFRLFMEFNRGMIVHMTQGIEDLCGYKDRSVAHQLSVFSKAYLRPLLQRGYKKEQKESKLLEMDRFETMRELKQSPSQSSFKWQQAVDELAERGGIPRNMLEEEEFFVNKKEDIEKQTEELTKDISHIRQLLHNPFEEYYANRNLVGEEEREKRRTSELSHMRMLQHRAQGMLDSEPKPKRSIFGRRQQQKKSAHQGIIMASLGSLGVHAVETGFRESSPSIDEGPTMQQVPEDHSLYTIRERAESGS